jgi:hypothetical protein
VPDQLARPIVAALPEALAESAIFALSFLLFSVVPFARAVLSGRVETVSVGAARIRASPARWRLHVRGERE